MVYGAYENQGVPGDALAEILDNLLRNAPLIVNMRGNRVFLVPADRGHYVVCDEVERPMDRG